MGKLKKIIGCVLDYAPFTGLSRKKGKLWHEITNIFITSTFIDYTILYGIVGGITSEWNPIKQINNILTTIDDNKQYSNNIDKLFGSEGLADTNNDGLDPVEIENALKKLGINKKDAKFSVEFPRQSNEKLEKAIKSYEAEKIVQ